MHAGAIRKLLYGCASVREITYLPELVEYLPVQTHKPYNSLDVYPILPWLRWTRILNSPIITSSTSMFFYIFRNFARIFFRDQRLNTYLRRKKKSRLEQDLRTSVNGRVITPFREGFILVSCK